MHLIYDYWKSEGRRILRRQNTGRWVTAIVFAALLPWSAPPLFGLQAPGAGGAGAPRAADARQAARLFAAQRPGAAAAFEALRRRYPHWWLPEYYLGRLAARRQQPVQAALRLMTAARLAPRQPQPRAALAVLAGQQGFWADAARQWRRYLRLAPRDVSAWRELAIAAQMAHQERRALAAMRRYLAAQPNDAVGQYLYALMLQGNGDLAGARAALARSLRLAPRFGAAWTMRAKWELQSAHWAAARASLRSALAANPNDPKALAELAEWERRRGHAELALPLLLRAQTLAPRSASVAYQLAQTQLRLHDTAAARAAERRFRRLRAARRTAPQRDAHAPTLLAWARAEVGRTPAQRRRDYLALLRRLNRRDPGDPRVLCRLARAEWAARPRAQARRDLQQALAAGPSYADALRTAAWLAQAGEPPLARRFYRAAMRRPEAAGSAAAAVGLARLELQAHHYHAALRIADAVPVAAQPQGAAEETAALAHAALGQAAAAQAAFRVALAMQPKAVEWYREDAVFLGGLGQWQDALKVLAVGRQQCGPLARLALTRAILLQLSGRRAEAQAQLRRVIAHPGTPGLRRQAQLLLAISYMTTDQGRLAAPLLVALTRQGTGAPAAMRAEAWYYRARLEEQEGRAALALRHARRAAALAPEYAPAWMLAGRLAEARGQTAAGEQDYQRAARAEPDWTAPHQALSRIYLRQGRIAAARRQQKIVAALNQTAPGQQSRELQSALLGLAR